MANIDKQAHWQAIYDAVRAGLNAASLSGVPVVHVFTGDETTLTRSYEPPLVLYRQDVERSLGTTGAGAVKVLRSNWVLTVYATNLEEALDISSVVNNSLIDAPLTTTDGYVTTALEILNDMSIYEPDAKVYACHTRFLWERSI